jgi:hypothetical protein
MMPDRPMQWRALDVIVGVLSAAAVVWPSLGKKPELSEPDREASQDEGVSSP